MDFIWIFKGIGASPFPAAYNGDVSWGRFGYHTGSTAISTTVGYFVGKSVAGKTASAIAGSTAGAYVAAVFLIAEAYHDAFIFVVEEFILPTERYLSDPKFPINIMKHYGYP